jgi:hypothetical protein
MSWDLRVYIDDIKKISKDNCENYLQQFGIQAQMHPETNFETDSGFLPFKVEFQSIDFLVGQTFISGFEIYSGSFDYWDDLIEMNCLRSITQKPKGLLGLFRKKANEESNDVIEHIINPDADDILKECKYQMTLSVGFDDSFAPILALAFATYLVEISDGVICDIYSGEYFYENVKGKMTETINGLYDELSPNNLKSHSFQKWS